MNTFTLTQMIASLCGKTRLPLRSADAPPFGFAVHFTEQIARQIKRKKSCCGERAFII